MTLDEHENVMKLLGAKCIALEERAGIGKAMEQAREGRFIPLGALGEPATPDEYFADERDCVRKRTRDIYFSVADVKVRKQLISVAREIDTQHEKVFDIIMVEDNRAVASAASQADRQPWSMAAGIAIAAVIFGYWVFGVAGAIAGAAGGFFIGQGVISNAKAAANVALRRAAHELDQNRRDKDIWAQYPPMFSPLEQTTGERVESLDIESAYGNVLRFGKGG